MLRGLIKKNSIIFLIVFSVFLIPIIVEAGGGCGCKTSVYDPYNYSSNYYGRTDSALGLYGGIYGGGLYGGGLYGGGLYGGGFYGSVYGGGLYGGGLYGGGLYGGGSYGGGFYGSSGLSQVTSKEYSTEQSQTWYIPGGEITNTISESTEISTIPTWGTFMYPSYNPYNFFGLGSWGGIGGWY